MSARYRIFIVHPSRLITDRRPHGDGLLAYRYILELAARGHHLTVACEHVDLREKPPENVTLRPIALRAPGDLAKRLEYAWKLRRLFAREHAATPFDVAHQLNPVFTGLSLGLLGMRVPLVLGPYVAHWPHENASSLKGKMLNGISNLQQRAANAIALSGPMARTRIVGANNDAKTHLLPYGIDLTAFQQHPLPEGDPVILYLATLTRRKGIFTLLEAFDLIAARIPSARLHIAGDGEEAHAVHAAAERSPYRERIVFLGNLPREQISEQLARATVFCLPSYGEPYGMSLVEAMATGRAVVACRAGGPLDLVDPQGGFLTPMGDAPALADALATVIETPSMAQAMGAFNRRAVLAYDWGTVIDQLENIYRTVICSRTRTISSTQFKA